MHRESGMCVGSISLIVKTRKWKDKWNHYQRKLKAKFPTGKAGIRAVYRSFSGLAAGVVGGFRYGVG